MEHLLSKNEIKQKRYYNQIAATYDQHYGSPWALDYRSRVFAQVLKDLDLSGKKVLDACSGGGENSYYFKSKGADVVGVDISEEQCKHYQLRFPEGKIFCQSMLNTQFPDMSFDIIVTESLHHLHPQVDDAMKEIVRLLKPGGYFILWEPSSGSILDWLRKVWYKLDRKYFEDNEASIDVDRLSADCKSLLKLIVKTYGGNVAHLFVMSSMHFRIPQSIVRLYAPLLNRLEFFLQKLQTRATSCWVLALFRKI